MRPEPDNPMPTAATIKPDHEVVQQLISFQGTDFVEMMTRAAKYMKEHVITTSDNGWNPTRAEISYDEDAEPPMFYITYTGAFLNTPMRNVLAVNPILNPTR